MYYSWTMTKRIIVHLWVSINKKKNVLIIFNAEKKLSFIDYNNIDNYLFIYLLLKPRKLFLKTLMLLFLKSSTYYSYNNGTPGFGRFLSEDWFLKSALKFFKFLYFQAFHTIANSFFLLWVGQFYLHFIIILFYKSDCLFKRVFPKLC